MLVDGVELSAFYRVEEDFGCFLNTFEEGVVFGRAGGGAFVGVVAENFLAVSELDLGLGGAVAVAGEAEDGVVVLTLYSKTW